MGWILAIALVATGCRQLLGIDSPLLADATAAADAPSDASIDAPDASTVDAAMWACGIEPPAPMAMVSEVSSTYRLDVSNITINNGGQLAVVTPGMILKYTFDYAIQDTSCINDCVDQIEIGLVPGNRLACPFDGDVNKTTGDTGTRANMFMAPMSQGVYDLRVNLGQDTSCTANGANTWWPAGMAPPSTLTIATLCVQ